MSDADDCDSDISLADPVNKENVIVGATVLQVAPDNFLLPVHVLRRYLDSLPGKKVTDAQFEVGQRRVFTVDSKTPWNLPQPESEQVGQPDNTPGVTFVQPPYGAGPKFLSDSIDHH